MRGKQKRRFKATTRSNHNLPVAENLLDQQFSPTAPNQTGVADLSYLALGEPMPQALAGRALLRAIQSKRPPKSLTHHSNPVSMLRGITRKSWSAMVYAAV